MFGFSFGEIAIILLVALIVIGPKDLPVVLRTAGKLLAKAKKLSDELKESFHEAIHDEEIKNAGESMKKGLRKIIDMDGNLQDAYDVEDILPKIKNDEPDLPFPPVADDKK